MDLESVEEYFTRLMKPKYLINDKRNEVVEFEKSFEKTYTMMEDNGVPNAKNLNVFEFYTRIEFLEQKYKPKQ